MIRNVDPLSTDIVDGKPIPAMDATPAGSLESTPDKPKKPKSLFQKIAGLVKDDVDIAKLHEQDDKELAELTRHQTARKQKEIEIEQGIAERSKRLDPQHQQEIKRQKVEYEARLKESKRFAMIIEMVDEKLRRNKPDARLVDWCFGILQNHGLFGIMSRPDGK